MKKPVLLLTVMICVSMTSMSQEKSLFSNQDQDFWENLTIERNDSSSLHEQLFNDQPELPIAYSLQDYRSIDRQRAFNESENSAIKHVMPIYEPKGDFKKKSIFPDNSMNYYLHIDSVKER